MPTPKVIFWDWNGTLLNDVDFSVVCLNTLLSDFGYTQQYSKTEYLNIFDFPITKYYARAGFDFSKDPFDILAKRFMEIYTGGSGTCPLTTNAKQTLETFKAMGIRQIVLSASEKPYLDFQIKERKIENYFAETLGLTNIYAKSKVAVGTNRLAVGDISPEDALMIGDTLHDAEVAKAMGIRCVLYSGGHHTKEKLSASGCDIVSSFAELLDFVRNN